MVPLASPHVRHGAMLHGKTPSKAWDTVPKRAVNKRLDLHVYTLATATKSCKLRVSRFRIASFHGMWHAVCAGCLVSTECLADAIASPDRGGLRAGTTEKQRRRIRADRHADAPARHFSCSSETKSSREIPA